MPPDINKSELVYAVENGNQLITRLDAIKFVGEDAIKDIIEKKKTYRFHVSELALNR